jgi:flavodoxin
MKSLVVVVSYHHKNTEKVVQVIAQVLNAPVKTPQQINLDELEAYDLIGIGSRIYGEKHYKRLLDARAKGYCILDEFCCRGFNTHSFLKFFGGINKGRPNAEDLQHAESFVQNLKQNLTI